jgi:hypothetical protein
MSSHFVLFIDVGLRAVVAVSTSFGNRVRLAKKRKCALPVIRTVNVVQKLYAWFVDLVMIGRSNFMIVAI